MNSPIWINCAALKFLLKKGGQSGWKISAGLKTISKTNKTELTSTANYPLVGDVQDIDFEQDRVFKIPALALVPGSVVSILNFKELFFSVTIALTN